MRDFCSGAYTHARSDAPHPGGLLSPRREWPRRRAPEPRYELIVFHNVGDPVASDLVAKLNQPGGNTTGFALFEPTLGGKWLELLSEIAPGLRRAGFMFNPDTAPVSTYMPSLETAARSLKVANHCARS